MINTAEIETTADYLRGGFYVGELAIDWFLPVNCRIAGLGIFPTDAFYACFNLSDDLFNIRLRLSLVHSI